MTSLISPLPGREHTRAGDLAVCPPVDTGGSQHGPTEFYMCHEIGTSTDLGPFRVLADSAAASLAGKPFNVSAASRRETWTPCPRTTGVLVRNRYTGRTFAQPCKTLTCPSCIVWRAIRVGQAIALASPDRLVTVTQTGREWDSIRENLAKFTKRLRRLGAEGETAYHVEPYRDGETHAHIWWRGRGLTHELVGSAARSAGIGWYHHISERPAAGATNPEYGLKMILRDRPEVLTGLWPAAERYLEINGGRLVHPSRGFWRDRDGGTCTLARAEVAARDYAPGTWVLEAAA